MYTHTHTHICTYVESITHIYASVCVWRERDSKCVCFLIHTIDTPQNNTQKNVTLSLTHTHMYVCMYVCIIRVCACVCVCVCVCGSVGLWGCFRIHNSYKSFFQHLENEINWIKLVLKLLFLCLKVRLHVDFTVRFWSVFLQCIFEVRFCSAFLQACLCLC
jgi:hypothetical protein